MFVSGTVEVCHFHPEILDLRKLVTLAVIQEKSTCYPTSSREFASEAAVTGADLQADL